MKMNSPNKTLTAARVAARTARPRRSAVATTMALGPEALKHQ